MTSPSISVITVCMNRLEHLRVSVARVAEWEHHFEHIVQHALTVLSTICKEFTTMCCNVSAFESVDFFPSDFLSTNMITLRTLLK